ncbi:hypothetical protein DXT76_12055 [Halobacillus trueperi]|uniref:Uncharacterized protein n=1 Tax=Halobacillus trueperi TaxID=156205 RepID=A0A3D8VMR5_9BACI|nr:hypothetical protein DXT76_12055 [Halobacillus trueperi]
MIFTAHSENEAIKEYHNNDQPNLAYSTTLDNKWLWSKTGGCPFDKWSANLVGEPYLWCGNKQKLRKDLLTF